ncbi:hypothetical protein DPMN_123204 [Dreissena polymorpha]|uniref:Uncharacterized protein n=1 Tax=Dreissena polymorpha TaxID=45954 RepID=A0A9D4GQV7_DREPO|nr:hypothetical protein DPMN_123204 [Dreissena polymorpha]
MYGDRTRNRARLLLLAISPNKLPLNRSVTESNPSRCCLVMSPHEQRYVLLFLCVVDVNKMTSTQSTGLLSVTPNLDVAVQIVTALTELCND